jgi:hypothetical protein
MLSCIIMAYSCKKYDPGQDPCPACPRIDMLEPSFAKGGEIVTIHGSNFSDDFSANIIRFNGIQITSDSILSGDTESIKVYVPSKCGTGPVTVDIDDELNFSGTAPVFTYRYKYTVSTYAGSRIGDSYNLVDGLDTIARFFEPSAMVIDANDILYVSDWTLDYSEAMIRKVTPAFNSNNLVVGDVSTVNISPVIPYISDMVIDNESNLFYFIGGPNIGTLYQGGVPQNPIVSTIRNGNDNVARNILSIEKVDNVIYAYDNEALVLLKFDLFGQSQSLEDLIGNGINSSIDGVGLDASIRFGGGLAHDNMGNLFFAERSQTNAIRKVDIGTSAVTTVSGPSVVNVAQNGSLDACTFQNPDNLIFTDSGDAYFSDYGGRGVRLISSGAVTTIAGSEALGFQDGEGLFATFDFILDIVIDSRGDLFVLTNSSIRKITIE